AGRASQTAEVANLRPMIDSAVQAGMRTGARADGMADAAAADYSSTRPVFQNLVDRSLSMDSQGEQDAAAGRASVDVQRQIGNALAAQRRSLASSGVTPQQGGAVERADLIRMAAERAGAGALARRNLVDRADALRTNVAQMGTQAANLSLGAGRDGDASRASAVNMGTMPITLDRAIASDYIGNIGAGAATNAQAANIGLSRLGVDMDAYKSGQSLTQQNNANLLDQYRIQSGIDLDRAKLGETGRQFDADLGLRGKNLQLQSQLAARGAKADNWGGVGSAVRFGIENWDKIGKTAGDIWSGLGTIFSDEDIKDSKVKADPEKSLKAIRKMRVERWKYKRETGLPADEFEGTYAQDFKRETGLGDGKTIPVISAIGVMMNAIKALDARVPA
ncbi:MAG: hypothetical protein ACRC2G_06720, partial [Aestuariivirga sp.]